MAASLVYDGQTLHWDDGAAQYKFKASSGIWGSDDESEVLERVFRVGTIAYALVMDYRWKEYEKLKDRGPIPSGTYTVESAVLKQPWAEFGKSGCKLKSSGGVQHIPRGDPHPGVDGDAPTQTTAGDCEDYWANWGYNRVRLAPHKDMVAPHRNGFYIHDSIKGFSHGCIETEQEFFVKHLFPFAKKNNGKRFLIKVDYKHERTYGGTLDKGGSESIKGVNEAGQIACFNAFRDLCKRLKANKPLPEEAADAKIMKPVSGIKLETLPQDRLLKYYSTMNLSYGINDLSKAPATLALIPGWWGSFPAKTK